LCANIDRSTSSLPALSSTLETERPHRTFIYLFVQPILYPRGHHVWRFLETLYNPHSSRPRWVGGKGYITIEWKVHAHTDSISALQIPLTYYHTPVLGYGGNSCFQNHYLPDLSKRRMISVG
jgi:hypothetical protein